MGVPSGGARSLLRLLLLQFDAVCSTAASPLLGFSHISNGSQACLQQGVFPGVPYVNFIYEGEKMNENCKFYRLHVLVILTGSPSFSCFSLWLIFILQLEGDDRSDEEEDDSDSSKEKNHKRSEINGTGARGRANGH